MAVQEAETQNRKRRPMSEETRRRISQTVKSNYKDPEFREKVLEARKVAGRDEVPEDQRKAMQEGTKRSWSDPLKLKSRVDTLLRKLEETLDLEEGSLEIDGLPPTILGSN